MVENCFQQGNVRHQLGYVGRGRFSPFSRPIVLPKRRFPELYKSRLIYLYGVTVAVWSDRSFLSCPRVCTRCLAKNRSRNWIHFRPASESSSAIGIPGTELLECIGTTFHCAIHGWIPSMYLEPDFWYVKFYVFTSSMDLMVKVWTVLSEPYFFL